MFNCRIPVTFSLIIIGNVIYFVPGWSEYLIYDRNLIEQGELWRFFSGHFVHYDKQHLSLNLILLLILGGMLEIRIKLYHYFFLSLFSIFFISAWMWLLLVDMVKYAGMSALLTSFGIFLALDGVQKYQHEKSIWVTLLCLVIAKVAIEYFQGEAIFLPQNEHAFIVVADVHLAGILAAFIYFLVLLMLAMLRK